MRSFLAPALLIVIIALILSVAVTLGFMIGTAW